MGLFDAAFNIPDGPITLEQATRFFGGAATRSGISVGPDTALRQATVYACVRVVSEDIAKVPLILYRRQADGGRERATDHPLYRVLHLKPNRFQTSFQFREMCQAHIELRGFAAALITRYPVRADRSGAVRELIPVHPNRVSVKLTDQWELEFKVNGKPVDRRDILYLPGLTLDGFTGVTPITYAREAIGLALAAEKHGALLFGNGARPGLVAEAPAEYSEPARLRLKDTMEAGISGENAYRLLMLEDGAKLSSAPVAMTNDDAQFLETRKYQRSEIAGLFRVPPHKVMDLDRSTNNNIEHQALEYVVDALMGRATRKEQHLSAQLLSDGEQSEYFIEHLFEGLLRGDSKSRAAFYESAVTKAGWMSRAEVRRLENLPPGPDELSQFLAPLNMAETGGEPPQGEEDE